MLKFVFQPCRSRKFWKCCEIQGEATKSVQWNVQQPGVVKVTRHFHWTLILFFRFHLFWALYFVEQVLLNMSLKASMGVKAHWISHNSDVLESLVLVIARGIATEWAVFRVTSRVGGSPFISPWITPGGAKMCYCYWGTAAFFWLLQLWVTGAYTFVPVSLATHALLVALVSLFYIASSWRSSRLNSLVFLWTH